MTDTLETTTTDDDCPRRARRRTSRPVRQDSSSAIFFFLAADHGGRGRGQLHRHRRGVPAGVARPDGREVLHGRVVLHARQVRQPAVRQACSTSASPWRSRCTSLRSRPSTSSPADTAALRLSTPPLGPSRVPTRSEMRVELARRGRAQIQFQVGSRHHSESRAQRARGGLVRHEFWWVGRFRESCRVVPRFSVGDRGHGGSTGRNDRRLVG